MAIKDRLSKVQVAYFQLHTNQRLYINTIGVLIICLVSSKVLGLQTTRSLFIIFILFWTAAICNDLIALYKKIYGYLLGKALLILLFSLCTNFAIALSCQIVNNITGVDPSMFTRTTALLSILSIPFLIAAVFGILYFVLLVLLPVLFMFQIISDDKMKEVVIPGYSANSSIPYQKTTRVVQLISFVFYCGLIFSLSQKSMGSYETFITDTARSFLYQMEMYPKAPCAIQDGSRVAFLNNGKVLIGVKNTKGMIFTVQECKSKP